MPPVELDPALALLPPADLAALLIAVAEAHHKFSQEENALQGEVVVSGRRYQWRVAARPLAQEDAAERVLQISPIPAEPELSPSPAP